MPQPSRYTRCLPQLARRTLNDLQPHHHAKISLVCVCACAEPVGTGIGPVCVERGGQTCPKQVLNHAHTMTHARTQLQRKSEQGTLLSFDPFLRVSFPLENEEKRLALRARAPQVFWGL